MILEEKREQGGCCLFPKPWGHLDRPSNSKANVRLLFSSMLCKDYHWLGKQDSARKFLGAPDRPRKYQSIDDYAKLPKFPRYLFLFDKTYGSLSVSYTAKTNSRSIRQRHNIYSQPNTKTMTDQDLENAPDSGSMARAPPVKKSLWDEAMPTRDSEYFSWC